MLFIFVRYSLDATVKASTCVRHVSWFGGGRAPSSANFIGQQHAVIKAHGHVVVVVLDICSFHACDSAAGVCLVVSNLLIVSAALRSADRGIESASWRESPRRADALLIIIQTL